MGEGEGEGEVIREKMCGIYEPYMVCYGIYEPYMVCYGIYEPYMVCYGIYGIHEYVYMYMYMYMVYMNVEHNEVLVRSKKTSVPLKKEAWSSLCMRRILLLAVQ